MSQGNKLPYLEEVERNLEEVFSNFKYLYHQNMLALSGNGLQL